MKTVYIAEKPDVGRAIAAYLWQDQGQKETGYIYYNDTAVTWAVGHILAMATPEMYGEAYAEWKNYPIIPKEYILKPMANTVKQLLVIKELIDDAEVVIHAGDPDREGQLLIDEILAYLDYDGKVKRLLINAKDDESMHRAFRSLRDNQDFRGLYEAGLARERADWLIGMNLTRAYTINARKVGHTGTLRIGRVKTPTLALVVQREKDIQNFQSKKYYELIATFQKDGKFFTAKLQPSDSIPTDSEGRIVDQNLLQAIQTKLLSHSARISHIATKETTKHPPLPHSLDTLQVLANRRYDYSPKQVLDTVQALYEKKYVSYPRSDCNYIPLSQKDDIHHIAPALTTFLPLAKEVDPAITSKAFNDKKITAHHAIIPTGVLPENLSKEETDIFTLIATRYVAQFFPPAKIEETNFAVDISDEQFTGKGTVLLQEGFLCIEQGDDEKKESARDVELMLPPLSVQDEIDTRELAIKEKKTTPPKRFTEGTLLSAMANIYKFVDKDNPNRERLKETKGIGTPATRDTIIAELQTTTLKGHPITPCIKKIKKELVPTEFGIFLIENVAPNLSKPDSTAEMEFALSEIAAGTRSLSIYMDETISFLHTNIQFAEQRHYPLPEGKERIPCPYCNGTILRKYSPTIKKYFHVCSNPDCVSPHTGKKEFYEDKDEQPIIEYCPICQIILHRIKGKNGYFWACSKCKKTFNDSKGKPDLKQKKRKD